MTCADAAAVIGVGPGRVRQLVADGELSADRFGNALLLDSERVHEYAHIRLPAPHRRVDPASAWSTITDNQFDWLYEADERDLMRRRLRSRASFTRGYAHRSLLPDLKSLIMLSGQAAAEHHGVPVDARDSSLIGYVTAEAFDTLPPVVWRPLSSPRSWNIEIGVIPEDVPWPFASGAEVVDLVTCWLDLEDHQERSARLALDQLPGWLRERRSGG